MIKLDIDDYTMKYLCVKQLIKNFDQKSAKASTASLSSLTNNPLQFQVFYKNTPFYFQTPICCVKYYEYSKCNTYIEHLHLQFPINNLKPFMFFCSIEQLIVDALTKQHLYDENDFQSSIEFHDSSMTLKIKLNKDTNVYNQNKDFLSSLEINYGDRVIGLIYTKGIYFYNYGYYYRFTALQLLKLDKSYLKQIT